MTRPNLLFLYTDEQRHDTLAATGNAVIDMPHLNALAETATVFRQTYCTQPVCTPSRGSLHTGLYPHQHGCTTNNLDLPEEVPCLPQLLPAGGWHTAHHGKWHLGDEVFQQHGFDEWISSEDTYHAFYSEGRDPYARSDYYHWLREKGVEPEAAKSTRADLPPEILDRFFRTQLHRLPEELCRPNYLANEATRYLREHADEPFALYVNFLEPHMPFYSCRDGQYDPADVTLPANFGHVLDETCSRRARFKARKYARDGYEVDRPLATEQQWRTLIARYWGMCSLIDTACGRILEVLRETGQWDNTLIVFTSDHGDMMSSHGLLGKGEMFEESSRVPLIVKAPGQDASRLVDCPVSQIDVMPTVLDFLGEADAGDSLPGASLAPQVLGESTATGRDVFIEWNSRRNAEAPAELPDLAADLGPLDAFRASTHDDIRTIVSADGWKLNHSPAGEHELFDLNTDPAEMSNRLADPASRDRLLDLATRIADWQQQTDDTVSLPTL